MGTRPIGFQENSTLPMPTRPPLLGEEHGQVGLVVGEPDPRLYELSHAVGAVGAWPSVWCARGMTVSMAHFQ